MLLNNGLKPSPAAVLASVVAEMAKPRVVESAKRAGDKLADSEDASINRPQKKRLFRLAAALSCYRSRN